MISRAASHQSRCRPSLRRWRRCSIPIGSIGLLLAYVIGMGAVLAVVDWRLALAMAVWVAIYVWWVAYCLPRIRVASKTRAEKRAAVNGRFVDSFTNMTTVKLFAHAGREEDFAREGIEQFRDAAIGFWPYRDDDEGGSRVPQWVRRV